MNRRWAEMARKVARCEIFELSIDEFYSAKGLEVITLMNGLFHVPSIDHLFLTLQSLLTERGKVILLVGEMRRHVEKYCLRLGDFRSSAFSGTEDTGLCL